MMVSELRILGPNPARKAGLTYNSAMPAYLGLPHIIPNYQRHALV